MRLDSASETTQNAELVDSSDPTDMAGEIDIAFTSLFLFLREFCLHVVSLLLLILLYISFVSLSKMI